MLSKTAVAATTAMLAEADLEGSATLVRLRQSRRRVHWPVRLKSAS
jgi:hypothetical protein